MTDTPARPLSPSRRRKRAARLFAVQALFQMDQTGAPMDQTLTEFETHRFGAEIDEGQFEDANPDHFRALVRGAVNRQAEIDQATDAALIAKWPIDKIDPTIRSVFRAALAEMLETDTPPKVAISEFVDIADAFFPDGKEARFVNAVLDHAGRALLPDGFKPRTG